jgi:hypothetical protein
VQTRVLQYDESLTWVSEIDTLFLVLLLVIAVRLAIQGRYGHNLSVSDTTFRILVSTSRV